MGLGEGHDFGPAGHRGACYTRATFESASPRHIFSSPFSGLPSVQPGPLAPGGAGQMVSENGHRTTHVASVLVYGRVVLIRDQGKGRPGRPERGRAFAEDDVLRSRGEPDQRGGPVIPAETAVAVELAAADDDGHSGIL